jgi:hypothetical protein
LHACCCIVFICLNSNLCLTSSFVSSFENSKRISFRSFLLLCFWPRSSLSPANPHGPARFFTRVQPSFRRPRSAQHHQRSPVRLPPPVSRPQVGPGGHPPPHAPEPATRRTGSHPASTSAGRALAHSPPWARASGPPCPLNAPPHAPRRFSLTLSTRAAARTFKP